MGHVNIATTVGYTHWCIKALADIAGKTALTIEGEWAGTWETPSNRGISMRIR
jgi:hypothetical protein